MVPPGELHEERPDFQGAHQGQLEEPIEVRHGEGAGWQLFQELAYGEHLVLVGPRQSGAQQSQGQGGIPRAPGNVENVMAHDEGFAGHPASPVALRQDVPGVPQILQKLLSITIFFPLLVQTLAHTGMALEGRLVSRATLSSSFSSFLLT